MDGPRFPKRRRANDGLLIPSMFVDPWIADYSRLPYSLRSKLTGHLSSATRELIESRALKESSERHEAPQEEVIIHF